MSVKDEATGSPPHETSSFRPDLRPSAAPTLAVLGVLAAQAAGLRLAARADAIDASLLPAAAAWLTLGVCAAFLLRVMRRKVAGGAALSLHQALSFDALFQGATLLHPHIPYPRVEAEFLRREAELSEARLQSWHRIRVTSAAVVPISLAAFAAALGGLAWLAAIGGAGALAFAVWRAFRAGRPAEERSLGARELAAVALSAAAAIVEGAAFVAAGRHVMPGALPWTHAVVYGLTLVSFELSPIPMALGPLELTLALLARAPLLGAAGVLVALAYRFARSVLLISLSLFYLPRYKLTLIDLFDPRLADALARTRRPEGGWPREPAGSGPRLSIVIPAFNEEARLPRYLPDVVAFAEAMEHGAEVIVVDDGSRDGTADYVEALAARHGCLRLLRQADNQGKGAAVRRGVDAASGEFVLFADADGATPIAEARALLARAQDGVEVVIGSRAAAGSDAKRSRIRGLLGAVFYRFTNLLAVPGVADTQCGFKLFHRAAARRIFPQVRERGFAFDVEVLFFAQKLGLGIAEVPVRWSAIEGSKVSPLRDALRMAVAVLRIRRRGAGLAGAVL